ncbi:MAG: histidinol dehydrogenase [Epulopiscium sp.]|nr:histidinol dehydrogenase [Candidatus Epulonipiscium sp.]
MIPIIKYNDMTANEILQKFLARSQLDLQKEQDLVFKIIQDIQTKKDQALFEYTKQFDGVSLNSSTVRVTEKEIQNAYKRVDPQYITILQKSIQRIRSYHQKQKQLSWFIEEEYGAMLGQKIIPLKNVGVYVPGGKAAYPSSVLMNVIPAKVAGVERIVMVTPVQELKGIHPATIVAAHEAGIKEIYKIGGAQAIASLAFGTESIPKVDKIVGPGNIFVALAKRAVYGYVNIDSIAGPSEILIIADQYANSKYIAADLLSQAEHDELACAILITDNLELAQKVQIEVSKQTQYLSRQKIIKKSLQNFGGIIIVENLQEAVTLSNQLAPEHLEICTQSPFELLPFIKNAGAIFLGEYSPEPLGDYMAGPNHVLPTNGTAKFFSPLSIDDFTKKSSIISFNKKSLQQLHEDIEYFARAEGLTAHENAVKVRFQND